MFFIFMAGWWSCNLSSDLKAKNYQSATAAFVLVALSALLYHLAK